MNDIQIIIPNNINIDDIDDINNVNNKIHIRVQQRTNRKFITLCENLDSKLNFNRVLKSLRKQLSCNGNIILDKDDNQIIKLQGDQHEGLMKFLTETGICMKDDIFIHGVQ